MIRKFVRWIAELFLPYLPVMGYVIALVAFLLLWHWKTTHQLSIFSGIFFSSLCLSSLAYGRCFSYLAGVPETIASSFTFQFLIGYLLFNTLLTTLSLLISFGIANNFLICVIIAILIIALAGKNRAWIDHTR